MFPCNLFSNAVSFSAASFIASDLAVAISVVIVVCKASSLESAFLPASVIAACLAAAMSLAT